MEEPPIIWINGAFGVGKTTVSRALASALCDAVVFDPEPLGLTLHARLPTSLRPSDFQHIRSWREATRTIVEGLHRDYGRPLIVPMTIVVPAYFDEIVGGLRRCGLPVRHFTLVASERTIRRRLLTRLVWPSSTHWALAQLPRCVEALRSPVFGRHVHTDGVSIARVVSEISGEIHRAQ
jgi:hypothetical protein